MKKLVLFASFCIFVQIISSAQVRVYDNNSVGVGLQPQINPNASAKLHIHSENQGLLMPSMTKEQRDAIDNPADGLMVNIIAVPPNSDCGPYYWSESQSQWIKMDGSSAVAPAPTNLSFNPISNSSVKLNSSTGEDVTVNAGAGISLSGTENSMTIINEAPDQPITITGASGTYPNFSIPAELGDISQVSVTSPITGGGTEGNVNIGIQNASALQDGALTSNDWTLFNDKVGGTGTSNFISKWSPSNNILTNSQLFENGVNIGLGTLLPEWKLHIKDISNSYVAKFQGGASSVVIVGDQFLGGQSSTKYLNSTGEMWVGMGDNLGIISSTAGATGMAFWTTGSEKMRLLNNGNLGIGTTNPIYKLDVLNDGGTGLGYSQGSFVRFGNSNTGSSSVILSSANENIGSLQVVRTNSGTNGYGVGDIYLNANNSNSDPGRLVLKSSGNVGIGTSDPLFKLHVTGDILVNSHTIGQGTGGASNVRFGYQSFNANTTGQYNTAIGAYTLNNSNTPFNTAVGTFALNGLTTGSSNTAIGAQAMIHSTSALNNLAVGSLSLANSNGEDNVSIGANGQQNVVNGNRNVSLGAYALSSLVSGNNNIAIGRYALHATTGSNNIGIGDLAGINKNTSNKLFIENSQSVQPLIGGDFNSNRVGINTDVDALANTLHVTGGARITSLDTDLAPPSTLGNTRMVISDNNGDLSFATIPTGSVTEVTGISPIAVINNTTTPQVSLELGGITNQYLASDAVTSNRILNGTIVNADLADNSINSNKISNNSVQNIDLGLMPGYSIKLNPNLQNSSPTDLIIGTGKIVGRGSTGNLGAISLGSQFIWADPTTLNTRGIYAGSNIFIEATPDSYIINNTGVVGSGTENYIPKWNSTEKELVNSQIFDNQTSVSIGTSVLPSGIGTTKLYVLGRINQSWNGQSNVLIGPNTGNETMAVSGNILIGHDSGQSITTGGFNTLLNGGSNITDGASNVILNSPNCSIESGNSNVIIGAGSHELGGTEVDGVISIGHNSGLNNEDDANTFIGRWAGQYHETGTRNLFFGMNSGGEHKYGEHNIFIGTNYSSINASNSICIGGGTITGDDEIKIGNIYATNPSVPTTWSAASDKRFKRNITETVPGLNFINKLKPIQYNWDIKAQEDFLNYPDSLRIEKSRLAKEKILYTGFLAQDVETAARELNFDFSGVDKPKDESKGMYGLRYSEFVVPLVKAVQEQQVMIDEQKKIIDDQRKELEETKNLIQDMIKRLQKLEEE